jgi:CBS-domain-containing membrane protein
MNYEEEKSKISGSVIIQAVAIIVGFILAAIIVSGFEFSSTIFKDPAFYISSAISFAVMMMTFQSAKNTA